MSAKAVLRDFTDAELLAEVSRRRKARERTKPTRWCDDCAHFAGGLGEYVERFLSCFGIFSLLSPLSCCSPPV